MRSIREKWSGIILEEGCKSASPGARASDRCSRKRVRHGDKVESTGRVDSVALPVGEDKRGRVLEEAVNVLKAAGCEALPRDLEERRTEIEDVDS